MIDEKRLKACHTIYGAQPIDWHIAAIDAALSEADEVARSLGVDRINLHSRLEQMAGLVWEVNQKEKRDD